MNKAIFLDRDGTIIKDFSGSQNSEPLKNLDQFEILPGVELGISILRSLGFILVVVTNQPDVARGKIEKNFVVKVNNKISEILGIPHFYICYHDDVDNCSCRKPKPGLLLKAALDLNLDFTKSYILGDRESDMLAGSQVGCKTIKIKNSNIRESAYNNNLTYDFLEAVNMIKGKKLWS